MPRFIEPGDCRHLRLGYKKDDKTIEEVLETNYRIHVGEQSVLHAYVHCSGWKKNKSYLSPEWFKSPILWLFFYTRKVIFIQLQGFPTSPYCRCCSVTKRSDSGIAEALKALKMHFWDPSQWDKMCFEYHRVIFHWKKWVKIFTFPYGQGRGCWPPPPLTVSLPNIFCRLP